MKTLLKRLAKALVALSLVLAIVSLGATGFESFLYDYKGSSVVKITKTRAARSGGTGFAITAPSGKRFILTNAHICRIGENLIAHTQKGVKHRISVIKIFDKHDLCLMTPIKGLRSLKIASNVSLHERVWLIGHPALRPLTLESGHYAGDVTINLWMQCSKSEVREQAIAAKKALDAILNDPNIPESVKGMKFFDFLLKSIKFSGGYCTKTFNSQYINNIAYGGNSGSPVVDKWGNVVGVLYAGRGDQPTASYTVPLRNIQDFLKDK